ncbi:MAG: hypothetical protein WBX15_15645 [Thermoanaerobaculia bacterium]
MTDMNSADSSRQETVLRFRDGSTERLTGVLSIDREEQVVSVEAGDSPRPIPFSSLKAVFFLRSGTESALEPPEGGITLSVEFDDGEVIRGVSPDYSPQRSGFFLVPFDRSKTDSIFVVNSAIVSIEIEKF